MKEILQTARLTLYEFNIEDRTFLFELMNTPGWLKWIGDRGINAEIDAENFIRNKFLTHYEEFGYGLWKVKITATGEDIGMMGFVNRDTLPHPDIGFALLPQFEGKGYALEAARATMTHGYKALGFPVIMSIAMEENERSIHLLQKLGLKPTGEVMEDQGDRVVIFSSEAT